MRSAGLGLDLALRVTTTTAECPGVRRLGLVRDDGGPLPSFPAGSHIGIEWAPGRVGAYSLTGPSWDAGELQIAVALRTDGSGGSRRMHELAVGDRLRATGPRSAFTPVQTAAHHVLVAGGIGVTPIVSHARWHAFWRHSAEVFYVHRPTVAPCLDELRRLCGARLHAVTDRAALWDALGPALRTAPFNSHVYTCGPPGLIAEVARRARAAHWVDERIHAEAFVPAQVGGRPFTAVLRRSGSRVEVDADEPLLDALERSGHPVPSLCRQGVCGECVTGVLAGGVEHRDGVLSPADRAGRMAVCVSRAIGAELELDR